MEKLFLLSITVILFFTDSYSQNVGINADGTSPDKSAMLDVKSANKGLLIPRVALTGTDDAITIPTPAVSLLVYNTATTTGATALTPGYFYWNGTAWLMLNTGSASSASWNFNGNTGTSDGTNFIGTTDNEPLNFRVNNEKAGRIDITGNTFWGYKSGYSNSTGNNNTANGSFTLYHTTTGNSNTGNGYFALLTNNTGSNNTALGFNADVSTDGLNNTTAIGSGAKVSASNTVQIGDEGVTDIYFGDGINALLHGKLANTPWLAIGNSGTKDGVNFIGTSDDEPLNIRINNEKSGRIDINGNTFLGYKSGYSNTTGNSNTAIGSYVLYPNTTGNFNTGNGFFSLINNITGNNNTALGYGADVSTDGLNNTTAIGNGAKVSTTNTVQIGNVVVTDVTLGDPSQTILHCGAVQTPSDARFKYNIKSNVPGLDFITKLTPVTYYFDGQKLEEFTKTGIIKNSNILPVSYNGEKQLHTGFLAQDVEKAAKELNYNFDGVHTPANGKDHYNLAYSQFVVPLVKAVQEQQQMIEVQNKKIDSLEVQNKNQAAQMKKQNNKLETLSKIVESLTQKPN